MPAPSVEPGPGPNPHISKAEADYNRLFYLSLDLLCVAGLDGYFKRVNPAWTRIFGWSEAELLSRPVADFMHPDDRERTLEARQGLTRGISIRGLENRYLCKDGSYRWLSWQSILEPSASMVFGVARDITLRRQSDQERLVTSKLESTGILAGGIAHDFNNLLGSLLLNLEMVSVCDATTAAQEQYLGQARQAVHAAKAITQQLLTFAEGGAAARQVTNLKDLLQQSFTLALRGSASHGECVIAPDLWPAEVDEAQIAQVVRGLTLNAREAIAPGGNVRMHAENVVLNGTPSELPPGDYLRISIADDGPGIPPDILPKIFDPYFSTKLRGSQKGMGLGLTICRTVIQKHSGSITIDSRPDRGTTVVCHLPAVRNAPVPATKPAVKAELPVVPRILVMDDEQLFRDIMAQTVRQLGYDVDVAKDGEEAIALYEQAAKAGRPFAAVALDLTVRGGMGGSQTLKVLQVRDSAVRAILMTGYSREQTFRDYLLHGFKAALAKPFSAETLRATLAEVLGLTPIRAPADTKHALH
jgi:two-component system, cell cycle sensor histidine kinase and response regulator CckA